MVDMVVSYQCSAQCSDLPIKLYGGESIYQISEEVTGF